MEITRRRRLQREFARVALDESDLKRLGDVFKDAAVRYETRVQITVVSASGDETISTDSPDFFLSENMPSRIRSVSMSLERYALPISLQLSLHSEHWWSGATVEANGTDITAVSGYFREIERILEERSKALGWLTNIGSLTVISFAVAWTTILSSLWIVFSIPRLASGLRPLALFDRQVFQVLSLIALGITLLIMMVVGLRIQKLIPKLEFTGKLEDPGTSGRRYAARLGASVAAVLVNLVAWGVSLIIQRAGP